MARVLVYKSEGISFRRRQKHELNKVLKELQEVTSEAVKTLKDLLTSQDEKIKLQAASKIVDTAASMAEQINEDELKRLFMQSKHEAAGGGSGLVPEDETPLVDFDTVEVK